MGRSFCAFGYLCALVLFGWSNPAFADTRLVRAGEDLQAALNAAQPGDLVLLEAGATFVGNFVLPVKSGSSYITVQTDPSGQALPGPGQRVTPIHAAALAKLRSPNALPALQTAARAHHWRLRLLEFQANHDGQGDIIRLGDGNQTSLADVPYEIELDRVYIHGHIWLGQKRGISLQSASTRIVNSYIADIKAVGMDTQAICGWNGPGPYLIENNYLEGAAENVMFGGADPKIVDLVPSDITFRQNHVRKPPEWRQPIVPTPERVASAFQSGGSLPAGSYGYRVAARRPSGQGTIAISRPSDEHLVTTDDRGAVQLTWNAVAGATEYRVYRRSGTSWQFWTVTVAAFTDTGSAGFAGAPPANGTLWSVKNLFEVKNARRLTLEGNVFENNWHASQTGYAILLKSWNEGGNAPWSTAREIVFTRNIVRNVAAAFNILGQSYTYPSTPARDISITHNLVYGVDSTTWGGDGRLALIGSSPTNVVIDHNTVMHNGTVVHVGSGEVWGFRYTNNLSRHNLYGIKGDSTGIGNGTIAAYFPDGVVQRNVLAGGNASQYPVDNQFPSVSAFESEFVDGDYHLRAGSPYRGAGTDGADLGADVDAVLALTGRALSGAGANNQPPVANPGGPYSALSLSAIAVNGTGSSDPDGEVVFYSWNWGDGSPDTTGATAAHVYERSATYLVTLTVVDDQGASATATTTAAIGNRAPVANAGGPYSGQAGEPVAVSGSGSSDADGTIVAYRWVWGDGSADTVATASIASHLYPSAGTYTVTLVVTDNEGATGTATTTASISAVLPPPPAPVIAEPGPGDVVVYAAELPPASIRGAWTISTDATAAGGIALATADLGAGTISTPMAAPADYFDATFEAPAGVEYRLWLRMRAAGNSGANDAAWIQFSDAVSGTGAPMYSIGSTSGLLVNLATTVSGSDLDGWGWQNGAYWLQQATSVRFASNGYHTLRVQAAEDGVEIDQILLSPVKYFASPPGPVGGDNTVIGKPKKDIVVHGADVVALNGWWTRVADSTAAGGVRLETSDSRWFTNAPLAAPAHYFDVTVYAQANLPYRLWLRLSALRNDKFNDSVWVQFSDVSAGGSRRYGIGTTSGLLVILATTANGRSLNGWGWQNGAYSLTESQQPTILTFPSTGLQTIRVQLAEDGVSLDQMVLSPERYFQTAPGPTGGDSTIVPK